MCQHLRYVRNKTNVEHFKLPGHDKNNMKFTILERKKILYGREREKYHIRKFNTFYAGINREP